MPIRNTHRVGSHLMVDDESGLVQYRENMVKRWDGLWVRKDQFETRQPQEFVQARNDPRPLRHIRPETPTGQVEARQAELVGESAVKTPIAPATHIFGIKPSSRAPAVKGKLRFRQAGEPRLFFGGSALPPTARLRLRSKGVVIQNTLDIPRSSLAFSAPRPRVPEVVNAPPSRLALTAKAPAVAGAASVRPAAAKMTFFSPAVLRPYTADGVNFDGASYLTRGADLIGNASGKKGTLSLWLNIANVNGDQFRIVQASNDQLSIQRTLADTIRIYARNAASSIILLMDSNSTWTSASGWIHILASWDLSVPETYMYINDVDDRAASPTETDDTIDYASPDWSVGATTGGFVSYQGDMADLYFHNSASFDLSAEANRRLFSDADGKPISLGADGSAPAGSAPIIFQSGAVASWHTNKGTGGGFTENGALTASSTSPSD